MTTALYITIDTEYSFGLAKRMNGAGRADNLARNVMGVVPGGPRGIGYQMDVFDRHGLKAVFFVDPMPALIWGVEAIADIVEPIITRGHDVQLHLHSEWLDLAGAASPLPGRSGRNIRDFSFEDQCVLIDYARGVLIAAGAPAPVAFRAGNYGANDDTLRALAALGIGYDTSHCPGIAHSECGITLTSDDRMVRPHHGTIEVPISCIAAQGAGLRHFQLTALTAAELIAALRHGALYNEAQMTVVSHSFELLSRDRLRTNRILARRFERFCAGLATLPDVTTATYADNPPPLTQANTPLLPHNMLRTLHRYGEQAMGNMLYGAK